MRCFSQLRHIWVPLLLFAPALTGAQQVVLYQDAERAFSDMVKAWEQGFYGPCARAAEVFLMAPTEPQWAHLREEAQMYKFKAEVRMDKPGIIEEILAFAELHQPAPKAQRALVLVGDDAYQNGRYEEAINYFKQIDGRNLDAATQNEVTFKLGYAHFVNKQFEEASGYLRQSREVRDKFYYPSNYYYGMTQYFLQQYPEAIRSFERVATSDYFRDFVPYYITQIHFTMERYGDVIGYGTRALESPTVLNRTDIHQLIGQAYFETGQYAEAIPHLQVLDKSSGKLRTDDFYQLGMAYYHTGRYAEAIGPLLEIRNETGLKAQYANYYLAQCYLHTGDRGSARNALLRTSGFPDDPALAVEAQFHYGRLAAEMGDDVDAIRVLQGIPPASPFYQEAQTTLVGILTQTQDYGLAIRELEAMSTLSPQLKGAYQKVCLFRAEQLLQDDNVVAADQLLDKSLQYKQDPGLEARACFWKGELAFQRDAFQESISWFDKYVSLHPRAGTLPAHQRLAVACYTQGYNYLRRDQHAQALQWFERVLAEVDNNRDGYDQVPLVTRQLLPDTWLRAGDCAFKLGQYQKASHQYDAAIRKKSPGHDYARFQQGMIKGLLKQPDEKLSILASLARELPDSRWADDALYQSGITYQERGQSATAIKSFQQLVDTYGQKSPLLHSALLQMGLIAYNNGQFEDALRHYKAVFTYQPDPETSREALVAIQEIYVTELDNPEAYFAYAESLPGFSVTGSEKDSIQYFAAEQHYALGDYGRAVESFDRYLTAYPTGLYRIKAQYLKAESLSLEKRYADALTAYEAVIASGAGLYRAPSLLKAALIAYNDGADYRRAMEHYQAYLPLAEDDEKLLQARMGLLRCAFKLRDRSALQEAAGLVISDPRATADMITTAHYNVATLAFADGDYDKALPAYNAVISRHSGDWAAEARYHIAAIYHRQGEPVLAEKLAEEAARANVGYPHWVARSLILLSDLRFEAGDLLNARAILEAILENVGDDAVIRAEAETKLAAVRMAEEKNSRIKPGGSDTLELQPNPKKD